MAEGTRCSVDACDKPTDRNGWCSMHYTRWKRHGSTSTNLREAAKLGPGNVTCPLAGCRNRPFRRSYCQVHYLKGIDDGTIPRLDGSATKRCDVAGCSQRHASHGWCRVHLSHWRAYGDPLATFQPSPPEERFFRKVVESDDGCWLWTGGADRKGYGTFRRSGEQTLAAHRWCYEFFRGAIPCGLELDHLCHNRDLSCRGGKSCRHRRCVNPDHLEPVTKSVNSLRMVHRGHGCDLGGR